jgi:hypothetical protein
MSANSAASVEAVPVMPASLGYMRKIILEGDRGQRLVLGLDGHAFLGFQRLVQAFRIAAAFHHAAGELVDDDDLVVLHDVVDIAGEQGMGAQGLVGVMHQGDVFDVIQRVGFSRSAARRISSICLGARLR